MTTMRVAVLGAGLQGACIALELARRGARVDLIEQDALAVNRASARNEGKIHLGFVYAKDETLRTARLMVRGALAFRPLLSRWTGGAFDRLVPSAPFSYLVPYDSAWSPRRPRAPLRGGPGALRRDAARGGRRLPRPARGAAVAAPRDRRVCALRGAEPDPGRIRHRRGLDPRGPDGGDPARRARREAGDRASASAIACARSSAAGAGFRVEGSTAAGSFRLECDQVVNALWDGRLAVDAAMGLRPARPWVHRPEVPRARRTARAPPRDAVVHVRARPLRRRGPLRRRPRVRVLVSAVPPRLERGRRPAAGVGRGMRRRPARRAQAAIAADALRDFDALVPGLAAARVVSVDAGVIFAWGHSDITDPAASPSPPRHRRLLARRLPLGEHRQAHHRAALRGGGGGPRPRRARLRAGRAGDGGAVRRPRPRARRRRHDAGGGTRSP